MNQLVRFRHRDFVAREAVWVDLRNVRFPRAEVGRIFGSKTPHHLVDVIVDRNPSLKTLGIPLTVKGITGQEYETICYSIEETHTLAIYSKLPGARKYLQKFPKLYEQVLKGGFARPEPARAPADGRERMAMEQLKMLVEATNREDHDRVMGAMVETFNRKPGTIGKWKKRFRDGEMPPLRKIRTDKGSYRKFPLDLREKAAAIRAAEPRVSVMELRRRLGGEVDYSTLRRWVRAAA